MKFVYFVPFCLASTLSPLLSLASDSQTLKCQVTRESGSFYAYVQPKVGDRVQVDLSQDEIKELRLGRSVIQGDLKKLPAVSGSTRTTFRSDETFQGEGTVRYIVQLNIVKGETSTLQSAMIWNSGDIELGAAELSCK